MRTREKAPRTGERRKRRKYTTTAAVLPSRPDAYYAALSEYLRLCGLTPGARVRIVTGPGRLLICAASAKGIEADLAALLGHAGGEVSGRARMKKIAPERRSEIAKAAGDARWRKHRERIATDGGGE